MRKQNALARFRAASEIAADAAARVATLHEMAAQGSTEAKRALPGARIAARKAVDAARKWERAYEETPDVEPHRSHHKPRKKPKHEVLDSQVW
jgi:hypothetical protein